MKSNFDTIISAEAGVPAQYEQGSYYVMSKATFLSLKSVKDANKRPILDTNDIMAHTLLGRNVVLCDYLPSMDKAEKMPAAAKAVTEINFLRSGKCLFSEKK